MPEWPNGAVSKTVNRLRGSRVRIPVFPQIQIKEVKKLASFFALVGMCIHYNMKEVNVA